MRTEIEKVSASVNAGYEVLKDVATTDMSQNLLAQERLSILLQSLMKQNTEFSLVLQESARVTEQISSTIAGMVMNMQFQDRNSQFIENSISFLDHMEQQMTRLIDASLPYLPGGNMPADNTGLVDSVASTFKLSEFARAFKNSLSGLPLDQTNNAEDDAIELF